MLTPTSLVTERLRLDPVRVEDAESMVDVLADERMYAFTGGRPPSAAELTARYTRLVVGRSADGSEFWFNWIARLVDGAVAVGGLQATVEADGTRADVAWEVGVDWQGRGLASEAAAEVVRWLTGCGVGAVRALVHPAHRASERVAWRAGLRRTDELVDGEAVWMLHPRLR